MEGQELQAKPVGYRLKKIEIKRGDAIDQIRITYDDHSEWICGHDSGKEDQMTAIMTPGEYLVRVSHERFENYRCAAAGIEFETNKGRCFNYQPRCMASQRKSEVTTMRAQYGHEIIALEIKKGVLEGIVEQPTPAGEEVATTHRGGEWYAVASCGVEDDGMTTTTTTTTDSPVVYVHFDGWVQARAHWRTVQAWVMAKRGRGALLLDVMHVRSQQECGDAEVVERCRNQATADGLCSGRTDDDVSMMSVLWTLGKQLASPTDLAALLLVTLLLWGSAYMALCSDTLLGSVLSLTRDLDPPKILAESWPVRLTCRHILSSCESAGEEVSAGKIRQALIIAFILVNFAERLLYVANVYIHHNSCENKNLSLKASAFRHVLSMDQPFFDTRSMSEIRGGMNVHALNNLITWNVPYLLALSIRLVMVIYFMACMSLLMTCISIASILVLRYGVLQTVEGFEKDLRRVNTKVDRTKDQIKNDAFEMISSVKAFSTERRHAEEYDQFQQRSAGILQALVTFRCVREFGHGMLNVFTFAAVLYCGIGAIFGRKGLTGAELTAFFLLFDRCQGIMGSFKGHWDLLIREFPDISRFMKLMSTKPSVVDGSTKVMGLQGVVEFKGVTFEYPSRPGQAVLRGMSHRFLPQKMTAIVGDSGAGKSTITKLLMRTYDVNGGSLEVDGLDIRDMTLKSLHDQIALVSQTPDLFNRSLAENIAYGKATGDATMAEVEAAARLAHCYDFIMKFRAGFDTFAGSRGGQLSGGQRQRIAIARAAIRDPKILILDEATSALDAESESVVQAALEQVMKGRTTIVIAHRLSTIRKADEIVCMKEGVIVERGTHEELMALQGHYSNLVNQQLVKSN